MIINFFFRKLGSLWDNVPKFCRAGQATDDNMGHSQCIILIAFLLQQWKSNEYYTRHNVRLYAHCLSCETLVIL